MKIVLVTKDEDIVSEAKQGFDKRDSVKVFDDWRKALASMRGTDLMIVDILATLKEPHKIAGYEEFAKAKMDHKSARDVPLVVIATPEGYKLDYMVGWPDFVFGMVRPPLTSKILKRVSTWV